MNIHTSKSNWIPILNSVETSGPFQLLQIRLNQSRHTEISGLHPSLLAIVTGLLHRSDPRQYLIVTPDDDTAEELRDDISLLFGDEQVRLLGHGMGHKAKMLDMSSSVAQTEALKSLSDGKDVIVTASARTFATLLPDPASFAKRSFEVRKGEGIPFNALLVRLDELGFERKEFVEEYGDYAVRGGIVDVFPYVGAQPVRAEFWGDTVESLREFDVGSQRSIRELESASIVAGMSEPPSAGAGTRTTVLGYLSDSATLVLNEPELIRRDIEQLLSEGVQLLGTWDDLMDRSSGLRVLRHASITDKPSVGCIQFGSTSQPSFSGSTRHLLSAIRNLSTQDIAVYIGSDTTAEAERLSELLEEEVEQTPPHQGEGDDPVDRSRPSYTPLPEALHGGFVYKEGKVAVFSEHVVFDRRRRRGSERKRVFKGLTHKELQQLRRGDFVVHQDYGIGTFAGLQKLAVRGADQEVMKVVYEGGDAIYVNLNYVNRVQKYSSREGHTPAISKLGSPEWDRLKARVRKKVKDIARDLIKLYARRKHEAGHAFAPDTHWQKEMEASFMYEDTPDQATATVNVKADMESPSPMDRLICGDVGFGKTEVAVRAAFKAVMDGKQTAVLVPTTILARQHLLTFLDRLGRYGVRVESLSRMKTRKEQIVVLEALKAGEVDILIGTHRILSKDVQFKNLGLLVIDEEHRFGVTAKEKLRQLRANVDTLTLTATPIPRTLQFSLMGARDLSLMATPPRNRLPIRTEIAAFDKNLIREAVLHELHRGGQIYFIHDRVKNIEEIRGMLEQIVPEAKIGIAHGQMEGKQLERVIMEFLDKKHDLLVCTKIIESGIDIPSVNTIIVNRADRFGLAELYQLRGRVGRSNIQAFASLLTPPIEGLPRQAIRRLQALQEFTELGSGFNLAMRDLEIRGAGNLLGAEQSGFILEMGFELYQRIVAEAVGELREQEFSELFPSDGTLKTTPGVETLIESDIEALIPEVYVDSDAERLDLYRRLYAFTGENEVAELRSELRDRFGEYPEEVEHLLSLVELKLVAARLRLRSVELTRSTLLLTLPPEDDQSFYESVQDGRSPFDMFMEAARRLPNGRAQLLQEGKTLRLEIRSVLNGPDRERVVAARRIVMAFTPPVSARV